ncbi:MAG TPA: tetratricopeptide repeat protein [Stellaceae bacterium]|jgi:hypothetical protein
MPAAGILMLVVEILCAVHAGKTGRPFFWVYLIIFVPVLGVLAYVAIELAPELLSTRRTRAAAAGVARLVDPEKEYRLAAREAEISDSIRSRTRLAEACLRSGRAEKAAELYRSTLAGVHETEPDLMLGLARAEFARGDAAEAQRVLDRLRKANPDYHSPDGHLLYARSLEAQNRTDEALYEYAAVAEYFPGQEAKTRYALLLERTGDKDATRRVFAEVCRAVDLSPRPYRRSQAEWYKLAKRHLKK